MELIGLCGFMAGNEARLTTLSSISETTSTAANIAWPGGLQAGDVAVLYARLNNNTDGAPPVTPSGFTVIAQAAAIFNQDNQSLYYKILDGSESGNIASGSGNISTAKMLQIIRGDIRISAVTVNDLATEMTGSNPAPQVCNASASLSPLIVYAAYGTKSNLISPRSFSPTRDAEITAAQYAYLLYKIYNSSPADVTVDMDDEGDFNCLQSFYLTFN